MFAAESEIDPRTHFLDFDAGKLLPAALRLDQVEAQFDLWVRTGVSRLLGGDAD